MNCEEMVKGKFYVLRVNNIISMTYIIVFHSIVDNKIWDLGSYLPITGRFYEPLTEPLAPTYLVSDVRDATDSEIKRWKAARGRR